MMEGHACRFESDLDGCT
jgi:hypothetical protein